MEHPSVGVLQASLLQDGAKMERHTPTTTTQRGAIRPNRPALSCWVDVSAGAGSSRTTLGVKGSQVQILSSRQGYHRPADLELLQVSGPFHLSESCRR